MLKRAGDETLSAGLNVELSQWHFHSVRGANMFKVFTVQYFTHSVTEDLQPE